MAKRKSSVLLFRVRGLYYGFISNRNRPSDFCYKHIVTKSEEWEFSVLEAEGFYYDENAREIRHW